MKKTIMVCFYIVITFCFLIVITSCSKTEENMISSNEKKRVQLQNDMISFFCIHQDDMRTFALEMKELDDNDPDYHYLYAVEENALIQFDGSHIQSQGKITEHPIFSEAGFFKETQDFEWVSWLTLYFDCYGCFFTGEIHDEAGALYAELFLFYTEDEPVTDEYMIVEPLAENWYFYCEYKE